jgi:hypothetical protein
MFDGNHDLHVVEWLRSHYSSQSILKMTKQTTPAVMGIASYLHMATIRHRDQMTINSQYS